MESLFIELAAISLFISIPGFLHKANYNLKQSIIPIYNMYFFVEMLEISPILIMILGILIIITPFRDLFVTMIFVFLPFILSEAFGRGKIYAVLTLFFPFIMYPILGYIIGTYLYNGDV